LFDTPFKRRRNDAARRREIRVKLERLSRLESTLGTVVAETKLGLA